MSFIDLPPSCIGFVNGAIKTPSCYTATTTKTVVPSKPKLNLLYHWVCLGC